MTATSEADRPRRRSAPSTAPTSTRSASTSDDPRLSALMLFVFQTGARISEAINLDETIVPDIDLVNRKVTFRDTKNGEDGEADLTIEMVYEIQQLREWKRERLEPNGGLPSYYGARTSTSRSTPGEAPKKPNNRLFGFRDAQRRDIQGNQPHLRIGRHPISRHPPARSPQLRNRNDREEPRRHRHHRDQGPMENEEAPHG